MKPANPPMDDASGHEHPMPANLDVYTADAIRRELLERIAVGSRITLLLGAVERCDCAGVQLLHAAAKSGQRAGGTVSFKDPSPAMIRCFDQLGLSPSFLTNAIPQIP